jgi:ABC-type transport system substrate-binding protein/class 3 adenylate cyclase
MPGGGQRRIVSILITDVVGSTSIGERLGPERSKALFDELANLIRGQVERFEGTVAQLTGDGVLALFGAPTAHEDDPERAVRAALGIQEAVGAYAAEIAAAYGVELAARAAVNTGPVVVPETGGPVHEIYNALGDTVNVAARLQEAAGPGGVAVGPETARHIDTQFQLEPLGDLALKGKGEPVAAHRVVGARAAGGRTVPPLVAREDELATLVGELEALVEGRGAIIAITGEPGIGKSRLVAEARARFEQEVRFLDAAGIGYARDAPYHMIRDLLRSWLGVGVSDPEARVRLELKAELSRILGDDAADRYLFLANLLGLSLDAGDAERLASFARDSVRRQTHEAVAGVIRGLAGERPGCVVLDDLHWADEPTLALVEELLPTVEEAAVGFVLIHRSEPDQLSWDVVDGARRRLKHRFTELELAPLTAADCAALAASAAGAPLPDAVAAALAERAGGNPFFVEEALHDLLERGVLRRVNAHFELADDVDAAVPALVQEALQARLDRLAPDTRDFVSVAAVTGRTFGLPLLERLVAPDRLRASLSELQRLDLVVEERRQPAVEYRFRHGLVQEAAYAGLTSAGRRTLHRRVAEALEELAEEAPEQTHADLARHYAEADEPAKAAEYLLRAGDAARAVYADHEAAGHYRRALPFLDRLGDEARVRHTLFRLALSHHLAYEFEATNAAWEEALDRPEPPRLRLEPTERVRTPNWYATSPPIPGHAYLPSSSWIATHLFRGLLKITADLTVVPELAERAAVSPDGLEYRFALRRDAAWSDGRPLTAEDFVFTIRELRAREAAAAHLLDAIADAHAVDERTLVLRLEEPRPHILHVLAQSFAFAWPSHAVGREWPGLDGAVYSGPYVVAEHNANHALLVANDRWAGGRGNVGEIDVVEARTMPEQLADFDAGRLDLLVNWTADPINDETARIQPALALQTTFAIVHDRRAPLDDVRVRRAIVHGLDRERLGSTVFPRMAPASGGLLPPAMPGHSHDLALGHDPDRARALLAEAGYPDGHGLRELDVVIMGFPNQPNAHQFVPAALEPLAAVGIRGRGRIQLPVVGEPQDADVVVHGWIADFPDPEGFLASWVDRQLAAGLIGSGVRPLLRAAREARDRDERLARFRELDRYLVVDEAYALPLAYTTYDIVSKPWLEGVWANPLTWATLDEVVVRPH